MDPVLTPEIREVFDAVRYGPAVSIIVPFEPQMSLKSGIIHCLEAAAIKVEQELSDNYPDELGMLVMKKLHDIFRNLNFNTYKKSIAIYVSPVFEKVLYLDFAVEERVVVEESFDIRDLFYSKKQLHKYLVLLLSSKASLIFAGNSSALVRIVSNTAESFYDPVIEMQEKETDFMDSSCREDILTDQFLRHIDNVLDIILNAYRQPLFVLSSEKILGHFKNLTKHGGAVVEYVEGKFDEVGLDRLKETMEPYITNWKKVKQKDLLNRLEAAAAKKKLATGLKEVWDEAMGHRGRLLVVEKNYNYAAQHESVEEVIYKAIDPYTKFSYIKDAVDEVMEKVLENGGDVEFVDEGVLKDYHRIALIE
ncbi:MAG: hypothetical protein ABI760_06390 [Ferruginibacter sp.]